VSTPGVVQEIIYFIHDTKYFILSEMTLIIFIIVLAILILVHEFGHFITAKKSGMKVEEFGIGFPPTLFSWKPRGGETRYSINAIPFGGFVKILGENADEEIPEEDKRRSFGNFGALKRSWVLVAGVFFNFLLAWLLIAIALMVGTLASPDDFGEKYVSDVNLTITGVLPDSPADRAGLRSGDKITTIRQSSTNINNPSAEEATNLIKNSGGDDVLIQVSREGAQETIAVLPEVGIVEDSYAIGVAMGEVGLVKLPIHLALWEGLKTSVALLWIIFLSLIAFIWSAIQGAANLNQVTGPVGIVGMVGDAARIGFSSLLYFTALISLHLSVLNLFPFPALDGGRLLFIAIEKIKGSKVNPKIETWVNGIGFALLILLMVVVTWNDITRLF